MFSSILIWWLALQAIGIVALPLTSFLFRSLPHEGYPFSKALGLLLVGYGSWLVAMLGLISFSVGNIVLVAALVAAGGWWATLRGQDWRAYLARWRARWRLLLGYELLFFLALLFSLWLRWSSGPGPGIASTEKPMDMSFLSGILNSSAYPPQDPWLAGYPINYYYMGYHCIGVLAMLTGLPIGQAFNLGLATIFSLTALMIAGLIVSLALLARARAARAEEPRFELVDEQQPEPGEDAAATLPASAATVVTDEPDSGAASAQAEPALAGTVAPPADPRLPPRAWASIVATVLLALTIVLIGGNQSGALQKIVGTERAVALDTGQLIEAVQKGIAGELPIVLSRPVPRIGDFGGQPFSELPQDQVGETFNWWWPSRSLWDEVDYAPPGAPPDPERSYAITEFPFFSFYLGDMHPHVLVLPFALLVLALLLATVVRPALPEFWRSKPGRLELALTGLMIGSLYTINSWDAPTYALLYAGALALLYQRLALEAQDGALAAGASPQADPAFPWRPYARSLALAGAAAIVAMLPFQMSFTSLIGNSEKPPAWEGVPLLSTLGKTIAPVLDRADIHEFAIIFGLFFIPLLAYALSTRPKLEREPAAASSVSGVIAQRVAPTPVAQLSGWVATGALFVAGMLLEFPLLALLPLAITLALQALRQARQPVHSLVLWCFAALCFVLFMTDLVYIRDFFDNRMNTVFKFYYQAWMIWGIMAAYGVYALLQRPLLRRIATPIWALPALLLLAGALVHPYMTLKYHTPEVVEPEIDALAFLTVWSPDEAAAIEYIRANTGPQEIVLTAVGEAYNETSRVNAATGRPTLLGWDGSHEQLWRGGDPQAMAEIRLREQDVPRIYSSATSPEETQSLLAQYKVRYLYVSDVERSRYMQDGVDKFAQPMDFLEQVFSQGPVQLYRVK